MPATSARQRQARPHAPCPLLCTPATAPQPLRHRAVTFGRGGPCHSSAPCSKVCLKKSAAEWPAIALPLLRLIRLTAEYAPPAAIALVLSAAAAAPRTGHRRALDPPSRFALARPPRGRGQRPAPLQNMPQRNWLVTSWWNWISGTLIWVPSALGQRSACICLSSAYLATTVSPSISLR